MGLPKKNVIEKFKWHAGFLKMKGHEPVNPIDVSLFDEQKDWHDYMVEDIAALLKCEAIYMLKDWGKVEAQELSIKSQKN